MSWFKDYNRSLNEIRSGKLKSVYFLYGSEGFLQDHAAEIIEKTFRQKNEGIDRYILTAADCSNEELENSLYSSSLFQSSKFIKIQEVKDLSPKKRKILLAYLEKADPANCLILTASKVDRRNKFLNQISSSTLVLFCNEPFDSEVVPWIEEHCQSLGKRIDKKAAMRMLDFFGTQMDDLTNELNKLDLYCADRDVIRIEDVNAVTGFARNASMENLTAALAGKDRRMAASVLANLIEQGVSDYFIVTVIYNFLWTMRVLKGKDSGQNMIEAVARSLGIFKKNDIDNINKNHHNYTVYELDRALAAIVQADRNIKTSSVDSLSNLLVLLENIIG